MASRRIVHMEIVTNDLEASDKFYAEAFGWEIKVDPNFNYHQFQAGSEQGGAFLTPQEDAPAPYPHYKMGEVLLYIDSDDINADLVKIESLGGKVLSPKFEIPGTGWMAVFQDPGGSRLALFQPIPPSL